MDGCEQNPIIYPQHQNFDKEQFLRRFLTDWTSGIAWNKIFKRSVLEGVYYEEGHKIDDEFFTYKAILNSEKIVMFDAPLYHYRIRKSGVMQLGNMYYERMLLDKLDYFQKRHEDVKRNCPSLEKEFYANMIDSFTGFWKESYGMCKVQGELRGWKRKNFFKVLIAKMPVKIKLGCIRVLYLSKPKKIEEKTKETTNYTCFV